MTKLDRRYIIGSLILLAIILFIMIRHHIKVYVAPKIICEQNYNGVFIKPKLSDGICLNKDAIITY